MDKHQPKRAHRTVPISSRSSVASTSSLPAVPTTRVPKLSGKARLYRTRRSKRDISLDNASETANSSLHLPEISASNVLANDTDSIDNDIRVDYHDSRETHTERTKYKDKKERVNRGMASDRHHVSSGVKTSRTERIARVGKQNPSQGHKTTRPKEWRGHDNMVSPLGSEDEVQVNHWTSGTGPEIRHASPRDDNERVENKDLKCLTCEEASTSLKLLPCLHLFCQTCLQIKMAEYPSRRWFRCDLCHTHIHVPENGIVGLEDIRFLYESTEPDLEPIRCESCKDATPSCECTTCKCSLCTHCAKVHITVDASTEHNIIEFKRDQNSLLSPSNVCKDHPPFTLELFCVTCSLSICGRCAINKHASHIAESLQVTAEERRTDLKAQMSDSSATRAQKGLRDYIRVCRKEKKIIQGDVKRTVSDIQRHIQDLKNELDELGKKMIIGVLEKESSVVAHLGISLDETERQQRSLDSSMDTLKHIVIQTNDIALVRKWKALRASIADVKKSSKPSPVQCVRIKYKPLLHSVKMTMGRVNTDTFLKRELKYTDVCSLQVKTSPAVVSIYPIDSLRAWVGFRRYLQLCSKDGTLGKKIDMEEQIFAINADSNHTIFVACRESVRLFGKTLETKFLFHLPHEPSDLNINENSELIVSFKDAKRVAMFTPKGKLLKEFDVKNLGFRFGARINDPWKVAINDNQVIFVTDYMCDTIAVYDRYGELKSAVACNVYRYASLCCYRGLLFVADYKRDCVQVLSEEGKLLQTCPLEGLNAPYSIAVDSSGDLWLGTWTGQVKVYTTRY